MLMYYAYNRQQDMKFYYKRMSFICCVVLFLVAYLSPCFAVDFTEQAQKYRDQGYIAQEGGDMQTAITFYTKAISLNPNFAMAYNDLGIAYEILGELDRAEENYLKAIALDKYYLATYTNLAYLYEKLGELKKAVYFWNKRIELGDPDDPWTKKAEDNLYSLLAISEELRNMFIHLEIKKLNREVEQKKIVSFKKDVAKAKEYFEKGKRFFDEDMYTEARIEFEKALLLTPDNPTILDYYSKAKKNESERKIKYHIRQGLNYYKQGDTDRAREEFRDALSVIPDKSSQ
jgi:tetratricopeptide (TPR) repeat protein